MKKLTHEQWLAIAVVGVAAYWRARVISSDTEDAISGASGPTIDVKLTGYWPFTEDLNAVDRRMEGGATDTHGQPLHTLEDFLSGNAPYVSVSGDDAIWPYGQNIEIANWPGVVFRVVDTGGHFRGLKKVYRVAGYEPLDICVASSDTVINPSMTTATIIVGDTFGSTKGNQPSTIQTDLIQGQEVDIG